MIIGNPITLGGGGSSGPVGRSDVNFYDYDGTIVKSYSAAEFANLTALPDNPSHTGLTAQGWNWTLADAKTYVADYGKLDVGQMYITDDGKTRIYIRLEEGRLAPYLGIAINGTATVEWGDGQTSTVTGSDTTTVVSTQHTYAAAGDYVIAITVSGSMVLMGSSTTGSKVLWKKSSPENLNRVYQNAIQKVEIGANTSIGDYAFRNCYTLASITIPSGVTSIGSGAFYYCYTLASITIPSGVTSIGSGAFYYCYTLASITIPDSVTSIGNNAFYYCYTLASITIPDSVTSIGNSAFAVCSSLASITIPDSVTSIGNFAFSSCYTLASITIPDSVTSIDYSAFGNCYTLASITIPSGVTSIGNNMFHNCPSLASITIPDSVTSIDYSAFSGCSSLASITIPSGVTSIGSGVFDGCSSLASITIPSGVTSINYTAFQVCSSLASITIPDSVTSIGSFAFYNCRGLGYIKFEATTPPTVSNSNAWNNVPTDCIIYVPSGTLSAYTSASNYPSSSTYTYVEY